MKIFSICFLITLILITRLSAQNIWNDYDYNYATDDLVKNLNIDSLHNIILFDTPTSSYLKYNAAISKLFYFHRDTETDFLINNLNSEIDNTLPELLRYFNLEKVYFESYIMGFLIPQQGIDRMRTLVNFSNENIKVKALTRLAEAEIYENYDYVKEKFLNNPDDKKFVNLLSIYSRDLRYSEEIKEYLINRINSATNYYQVINRIGDLGYLPATQLEMLNQYFENKNGKERYNYFRDLELLDKDGQPERSMFALQNEVNDTFRVEYLPTPYKILNWSSISKRYLEPKFINFISNLSIADTNSSTYQVRKYFLQSYTPIKPDSITPSNDLLNNLYNYVDSVIIYTWLGDLTFSNELKNILTTAKTNLQNGDSLACRVQVKAFQDLVDNVYKDSLNSDTRFVTIEGWKFLYWNAQYILDRLPEPPANPNLLVNLKNSLGNQIPASNVMFYEGSWKDAVNNGDGTFTVITTRATVSIRVYYEYASLQIDNVPAQNNTYTFTTVNAAVQLKNSLGNLIDAGTVQYYAGAWRTFGTTSNGVAYKELLPINYSFRMTYEYSSIDKQQNLSTDPTVVFQTVNAAVQLKNSLGNLIDVGTVQYYAGAWRTLGTTSNGVAYKELLPINDSSRMTYEYVSKDKQQNLSTNPVVDFSTVLCSVKVSKTSNNQPIGNATVKYYAGAWRNLGTTNIDGITTKELLPANISFRATLGSVSLDKQQDISVNSLVEILLNIP